MAIAGDKRSKLSASVGSAAAPIDTAVAQAAYSVSAKFEEVPPLSISSVHLDSPTNMSVLHEHGVPLSMFAAFAEHDTPPNARNAAVALDEPFRALFESIDDGIATLKVVFDENDRATDYRFLAVNRAHQAMSGFGSEVVGKCVSEVVPDLDPSIIQRIGKVALSGEPSRFEDFIRPLNRWFKVYLSPFGGPESRTVVAVFRDITERKRQEHLQAFLLKLSDALRPIVDPEQIQVIAANLLGEHLQVNHALYGEVRGEYAHVVHSYANGLPSMVGSFHNESFGKRMIEGHRVGRLQVCVNSKHAANTH